MLEGEEATAPEGQQEESSETVEEARIRLEGEAEEVPLSKVQEVWKAYKNDTSWQAKNTQKAQALAAQERDIQQYKVLGDYLKKNPAIYEKWKSDASGQPAGQVPGQAPQIDMTQITSAKQEIGAMVEELKVAREMDGLKSKYPDFFKEAGFEGKLIQHCLDNDIPSLEWALKDMTYDKRLEMGLSQGQQKLAEAKEKSRRLASPGGVKGGSADTKGLKGLSRDEWVKKVAEDPRIQWDSE